MDEKKLAKQLRRITIITIIGSLLLSAIGFGIFGYIMKSAHEAEHAQLQASICTLACRIFRIIKAIVNIETITRITLNITVIIG